MAFLSAPPLRQRLPSKAPSLCAFRTMATAASPVPRPPRVVPSPLPNVLIYDHCPFCIRVRHALGLKNIKHNLIWLANDDINTPTALVQRKVVPIFQSTGASGPSMAESLEICETIDSNPEFGEPFFRPLSGRSDIEEWMTKMADPMRRLTRVRYARGPFPEFAFEDGRQAYVRNHPLENPSSYEENFAMSDALVKDVQDAMVELEGMIFSKEFCTEGGISYDDILLFAKLRSLTIVKGLVFPKAIREYVEYQAAIADIPLLHYCAM